MSEEPVFDVRFDCIPPVALRLLAQCLHYGAIKYGDDNYRHITLACHINHAMNHINEWNIGDRTEAHLVHAMARLSFAISIAVETGRLEADYNS